MNEVKKWYVGVFGGEAQARACSPAEFEIINEREGRSFVLAEDFDRVTAERDALQQRLAAADERADVLERVEARYRWLQKATPYRFKKIQDASVTDGGDVLYFHADRFDAAVDAELKPGEVKPDEHACTGCGAKGWTANCKECVPY